MERGRMGQEEGGKGGIYMEGWIESGGDRRGEGEV